MASRDNLQSVELFAGGGGMALGLHEAGFDHQLLIEWWAPAARVLRHNANLYPDLWKPDAVIEKDVNSVTEELSEPGTIHLVAGGPPCQPFSLAGAHAGHADARNQFPSALRIVRRLRPKLVIFENVPGLLRPTFAPYVDYVKDQLRHIDVEPADEEELWDHHHRRILQTRQSASYRVYQEALDAADLGVPQSRKRVFIVGIRQDLTGADTWSPLAATNSREALLHEQYVSGDYWHRHGLNRPPIPDRLAGQVSRVKATGFDSSRRPWVTLRDALAGIPKPGIGCEVAGWPNHQFIDGARTYAKHTGSPMDMPSKTIKAGVHGVAGGEAMLRELDGSVRYLTIREAAMVQGFPQMYEFPGVRSRVMGVIGNAVAVKVAAALGNDLRDHLSI